MLEGLSKSEKINAVTFYIKRFVLHAAVYVHNVGCLLNSIDAQAKIRMSY